MRGRRWTIALAVGAVLLAALPQAAEGQTAWTVAGRVVDAQSGVSVSNALVTLEGHGAVLSSNRGLFRFARVPSSEYSLRVEALGYSDFAAALEVNADTMLVVALEILPVEVDGLTVELGTLDFDGRVRDPRLDAWVYEAEVRSDQGHHDVTSLSGRFDLDDVFDGPSLRLTIRGFRYMPLDTTFIPDDEDRHVFDMAPDPVMSRMIESYVARLDERAQRRIYEYQPALNREDLAEFRPNASLRVVMEAKYPLRILEGIVCVFLDEREYPWWNSHDGRMSLLEGTSAHELERVELLEFPGEAQLFMARVYTRRFFQRQVASPDNLVEPSAAATWGGTFCR